MGNFGAKMGVPLASTLILWGDWYRAENHPRQENLLESLFGKNFQHAELVLGAVTFAILLLVLSGRRTGGGWGGGRGGGGPKAA